MDRKVMDRKATDRKAMGRKAMERRRAMEFMEQEPMEVLLGFTQI